MGAAAGARRPGRRFSREPMDRADRIGLGVAVVGHAALLAALSLSLAWRHPPVITPPQTMDVQLTDEVGLQSAAPEPATEAPREMEAPEQGKPAEAPPPTSEPLPEPKAATPPPQPRPEPAPTPKPALPKPAPVPKPADKPKPKPVEKPAPEKPAAKPAPAKASLSDILKDVRSAAKNERAGSNPAAKPGRAAADRLGPDFLKGVLGKSPGKGERARAAVSGAALNGLAAAIKRQIQPCYDLGGLGGTPAMQIVTVLQLRFNEDGSVAGTPQVVEQTGISSENRSYARQMVEVSRRAVLRCAPLKLPAELYAGGWENITMGFIPGQLN